MCIQTLGLDSATPEEQALGRFTCRKLKSLSNWSVWKKGEHKQLNQFHKQGVFGNPIDPATLDPDAITLSPMWQHDVKRDRTCCSTPCCDRGERAAPILHAIACTWSSVWKRQFKDHFLPHVLPRDTECVVQMSKMPVLMLERMELKHVQELMMPTLDGSRKSQEKKSKEDQ